MKILGLFFLVKEIKSTRALINFIIVDDLVQIVALLVVFYILSYLFTNGNLGRYC